MHYRNEIIIPNTDNVDVAIAQVMAPYDENAEDRINGGFWDFYVIGGRYSGSKITDALGDKLDGFYSALQEKKVTVSGFTAGKQTLEPACQIPMVDKLWREHFPEVGGPCPLFSHSNDQYSSSSLLPKDIEPYANVSQSMSCERIIIAAPSHDGSKIEAVFIVERDYWTGCNHLKTEWDGTLAHCMAMFLDTMTGNHQEYIDRISVKYDHLVVTVDTHS